ncbi:MAG TPA: YfhO family protein [Casimicrobiaceae bacterium]|nr:YfhO family protein [Casimicrobiaceae bacterium]
MAMLAIPFAYALWYAVLFSPILAGRMLFPSDGQLAAFFTPIRLWNPLPLAGMPGVAEPHLAQLYPLRWLFAALPDAIGFNLFVVFSYALASSLAFGYVHAITRSKLASAIAGLIFGTSGYLIAHLGHTGLFAAVAWMPLTLWSLEMLRRRFSAAWLAIGVLSIALTILAGHPQAFVYSIYLGGAYALFLGSKAPIGWVKTIGVYVAMTATGAAIAAAHLLPMLELARLSVRSEITFDAFREYALPIRQLPMFLFPYLFGGGYPPTFPAYFGRWNLPEMAGYMGLMTLMLALVGAIRTWRSSVGAFWLAVAAVSLLLTLGDATPLLWLTYHLPAIDKLRAPARHLQEATFAFAVLAGLGVAAIQKGDATPLLARRAVIGVSVIVATTLLAIVHRYGHLESMAAAARQTLPRASANPALGIPVAVLVVSAIALLHWVRAPGDRTRSVALAAALAIDLGSHAWFQQWRYGTPVDALRVPRYAERYRDELVAAHQRVMPMMGWQEPRQAFSPMMSQLYGLPSVSGYGPLLQRRYAELSLVTNGGWINPAVLDSADRAPDLLAGRYIVAPNSAPAIDAEAGHGMWNPDGLRVVLGSGCGASGGEQLRLPVPDTVRFDEIAIVSAMSCSTSIEQGAPVARVSLIDTLGRAHARVLHAGEDTSEWAIDCDDVKGVVKHQAAKVFDDWHARRADGSTCEGHRFLTRLHVEPKRYGEIVVDWLAPGAATLRISRMSLVDTAHAGAWHVRDGDPRLSDRARFTRVEDFGTSSIYRNERALPRAWLVSRVVAAKPGEILRAIRTSVAPDGSAYDPHAMAFVEEPLRLQVTGSGGAGDVTIERFQDNEIELETQATRNAFLVVSDVDYPGWTASIDGVDARVLRTDYALRGLPVPAGRHRVVLRYRPLAFYAGLAISLSALAALAAFVIAARRTRVLAQRRGLVPITTQL